MTIQWKLATLVVTGVAALGLSATSASGQFVIPSMAEDAGADGDSYRDVDEPEKIKTTHNDELDIDVVSGGSEQDMINHAMQELIEEDGGVKAIATGSGLGFVATAVSSYNYAGKNENLSRLQQRLAAVQANLGAKTVLVEFLNGVSVEGQEAIAEQIMALDTETQQDINRTMSASEQRESAVSGLINGVVTYDFKDDPTGGGSGGTCSVTVVTTPRTRGQLAQGTKGNLIHAKDFETATAFILTELKSGLMPPNGGRTILLEDGSVAWVGFGSALIRANRDPKMRNAAKKMAKGQAKLRAQGSLYSIIKGESILASDEMAEQFDSSFEQFEVVIDEAGNESSKSLEQAESAASSSSFYKNQVGSQVKGTLPPGCMPKSFVTKDGHWQYTVYIYHPELTAAAKEAAKQMAANSPFKNTATAASGGSYMTNPDGSFERDANGGLIPTSLGSGRVTADEDL